VVHNEESGIPDPLDDIDELFKDAAKIVVLHQQGSVSLLQRKLKIGYNRAGRIIDQLYNAGIVGPFQGSTARDVKITEEEELDEIFEELNL
jgi:S-DNA-T family DNA segregation ATPase FtsK/SpoIIIE